MKIYLLCLIGLVLVAGCQNVSVLMLEEKHLKDADEKLISVKPPKYSDKTTAGYVIVGFSINENGRVEDAVVLDEYPPGVFTDEAIKSVKSSIYKPKYIEGKPVRVEGKKRRLTFNVDPNMPFKDVQCGNKLSEEALSDRRCTRVQ